MRRERETARESSKLVKGVSEGEEMLKTGWNHEERASKEVKGLIVKGACEGERCVVTFILFYLQQKRQLKNRNKRRKKQNKT